MMAISRRCLARLFCLPHFRHFTYPRWVRLTLNEPQKIHFLPRKKLAAHPNTLFCPVTMRPPAYPMVTKRPNYQIMTGIRNLTPKFASKLLLDWHRIIVDIYKKQISKFD